MSQSQAHSFFQNPEVQSLQTNLIEQLQKSQKAIDGVRGPLDPNDKAYQDRVAEFGQNRGGATFFPYLSSGLGHGPLVELDDGSVKYDFISGIGVHIMGHSHAGLTQAVLKAALEDTVMLGNLQQNVTSTEYVKTLLKAANLKGGDFKHCFLTSSGVMAGENTFKICFQKKAPADRVLVFERCFMGRTMIMSQTTDNPNNRNGLPHTLNVDYVPFFDHRQPEESIKKSVAILKQHLKRYPGKHALMSMELVQGEGGFYPGQKEFFKAIIAVLKEHDIPAIADEVQTFARTSEIFAFQHFDLQDDIDAVWIGKASQACATIYKEHLKPKPGLLSQTYTASTTAVAAGNYIVNYMLDNGFYGQSGRVVEMHNYFESKLKELEQKHPGKIQGPYGVGAMVAFQVGDGSPETAKNFVKKLYDNGVMSFSCGREPSRIRFLVPVGVVENKHIDEVCGIVEKTL